MHKLCLLLLSFMGVLMICSPISVKADTALEGVVVPVDHTHDSITVKAIKSEFAANEPVVVMIEIENHTKDSLRLMDPVVSGLCLDYPEEFVRHNLAREDDVVYSIFGSVRMYKLEPGGKQVWYMVLDELGKFKPGEHIMPFRFLSKDFTNKKSDVAPRVFKASGEIEFAVREDAMADDSWKEYLDYIQHLPEITPSEVARIVAFVYHSEALKLAVESVKDRHISSVAVLNAIRLSENHKEWCTRDQIVNLIRHGHTQALSVGLELISSRNEQIPRSLVQAIVEDHSWARSIVLMRHYELHGISDHLDLVAQLMHSDSEEVQALVRKVLDESGISTDDEAGSIETGMDPEKE
ncbi:MAG: hypothetical protein GVY24_06345 [Planctomycetes bacterium]|jgi:hypothetical protein|nr:hypothetical protein [Planctomycetota bacterium]